MKWGILATGNIATKFVKTISAMAAEGESVVAVGSRSLEKAKDFVKTHGISKAYGSYEELLADSEVEAVYIATPNNLHEENARACLLAGKHVLCEKPFTTNAGAAEALYQLAEERGLFLMEGFWIRFLPLYEKLLELIRSEEFGKLRHARCDYGFIAQGARRERKFKSELGGGALLDIGIYTLGFLNMVMGAAPDSFTSEVRFNEFGTDEFSAIQLRYSGRRTAHAVQSIGLQIERRAALYFDTATIYLPDFQGAYTMTVCPNGGEPYITECPPDVNGFEYEIREVTRCVSAGKPHSDTYTPENNIAVLRLLDDIRRSWGMRFAYE